MMKGSCRTELCGDADGFDGYDDSDSGGADDGYDERMLQNIEGSFVLIDDGYDAGLTTI